MRVLAVCALALAVGCGSGSTMMATAQLAGTVYEVDGQNVNLAGVQVTLKETGEWAWTDAVGSFEFAGLEPGTYTLDFMGDGESSAAEGDEFTDGDGDPKVDVPAGGRVEIRVALEGGDVKDFSSDEQHAMAKLHLTDAAEIAGYHVGGGIKIAVRGDGTLFKVCVEGLDGGDVLDIYLAETWIGSATADADGRACLVLENDLPLDAPNLDELAGLRVDVYLSGTDLRLLVGEVPELMEEHDGEDGVDKDEGSGDGGNADKPDEEGDDNAGEDDGDEPSEDGTEDKDEGEDKPDGNAGESDKPGEDGTDGEGDGADSNESEEGDGTAK